jgi:GNAT superfamily N-acetyltransferase
MAAPTVDFSQTRIDRPKPLNDLPETTSPMPYRLRTATLADGPAIGDLIARSIRSLGRDDYSPAQIEAALQGAFGLDTALVRDETYFLVFGAAPDPVACGGWSRRRTLFGGDAHAQRDESLLDPRTDAAKVRAFFVDPAHARRGLGRMLLERCEDEARSAGFTALELMATLPGLRLYERHGFVPLGSVDHRLPGGLSIRFVPMRKALAAASRP